MNNTDNEVSADKKVSVSASDADNRRVLSVVIPCYNERDNILAIVKRVRSEGFRDQEKIVVDDFSTDGTREILEKEVKPLVSKIIYHEKNGGKGAALRTGFAAATGDVVIVQDADMEFFTS